MSTSPNEILTGARTMWELVDRRADASPDHPMLIAADGETVTFGEFRDRAERVAAGLQAMGVTAGSVVSWQLPTRIDTIVLSIALSRLGAVQNPIIHLYREREVGFALRQTGASLFVIPGTWRDTDFAGLAERALADALRRRPTILTIDAGLPEGDPACCPRRPPGPAPEDAPIRWIYYTSGSTADPKGVQHTDQTLIAGGWGLATRPRHGPRRRRLHRLPLRAHRRARLSGDHAHRSASPPSSSRPSPRPTSLPDLPPPRRHHGRRQHRLLRRLPRRAAQDTRATRSSRRCASCRVAARPSHLRSTSRCATRSAAAGSCTATA